MRARTVLVVLVGVGIAARAAAPSAQQREAVARVADGSTSTVPSAHSTSTVEGLWDFNPGESHEDQRNWRRVVHPDLDTSQPAQPPRSGILPPEAYDNDARRALRDLLEIAQSYTLAVREKDVTITDDLGRSTTYATDGRREKHQFGATEFDARTTWDHALLSQQIEAMDLIRMTQVFMPSEDGRSLFIWIKVEKPEMNPPIKPITRVYSRTAPAPGAAKLPRTSLDPARPPR
jgi:hypothetical protein